MDIKQIQLLKSSNHQIFMFFWFGIAGISYFFWDQSIAWYMHNHVNATIDVLFQYFTKLGWGSLYLIGSIVFLFIAKYILKNAYLVRIALFFLAVMIISGLTCDAFKILLSRARPVLLFEHGWYGFYFFHWTASMWSFPSGHATTIGAMMTAFALIKPRYTPLFLVIAILVALSRVIITAHFLSDVMIGLYLGFLIALGMFHLMASLTINFKNISNLPQIF